MKASGLLKLARLAPDAAIVRLGTSLQGLQQQAEERLAQYGPNTVAHEGERIRFAARTSGN